MESKLEKSDDEENSVQIDYENGNNLNSDSGREGLLYKLKSIRKSNKKKKDIENTIKFDDDDDNRMLKNSELVKPNLNLKMSNNNRLKRLSTIKNILSSRQKNNNKRQESMSKFRNFFKFPDNKENNENKIFNKIAVENKTKSTNNSNLPIVRFDDEGNPDIPNEQIDDIHLSSKSMNGDYNNSNDTLDKNKNVAHFDSTKVRYYLKVVLKFAFSQIGLAGLVIGYVILGSIIFMKIESSYEKITQEKIETNREEFYKDVRVAAEHIVNEYLRLNFHHKYNQYRNEEMNGNLFMGEEVSNNIIENSAVVKKVLGISEEIDDIKSTTTTTAIIQTNSTFQTMDNSTKRFKYIKEKIILRENKKDSWHVPIDHEAFRSELSHHLKVFLNENDKIEDKDKATTLLREEVWTYSSSLLYSATVITTIGYGNITPKSHIGKIFTMIYAMIGIPLMFMCLTNTGDLLAELFINLYSKTIRFIYKRLCRTKLRMIYSSTKFAEKKQEMLSDFEMEYDNPNDRHVPIVATIGVLSGYIFIGAVIFSYWENWNYLDGAYFCFITFTTIGFGDFVPGKNTLGTDKGGKAALCTLYLLLGMVIVAMCFKLMQDEVFSKARWIGRKLGIIDKN